MENSFWILNNESEDYSALDKSIDAEYLIVGAGLTGLHTAYLLSDISSNIVIVDANKVGSLFGKKYWESDIFTWFDLRLYKPKIWR